MSTILELRGGPRDGQELSAGADFEWILNSSNGGCNGHSLRWSAVAECYSISARSENSSGDRRIYLDWNEPDNEFVKQMGKFSDWRFK